MKKFSITSRSVEHFAGMLALALLATGLLIYAVREPLRIDAAQTDIRQNQLDEAMTLYAQNCSVCHGLAGEGIGATPPLDNDVLRTADNQALAKIIARGLYGTSMPAWSKEDGGPLSDYQINTLVTLIQYGEWPSTQNRVVNLGLAPLVPFTTKPDPALLEQVRSLPGGETLAQGIEIYAAECVACHGADGLGTTLAPALNDPAVRAKDAAEIERTILNGVPTTLMASWQNTLSTEQVTALVDLITSWDTVPDGSIPAPDEPIAVTAQSLELGASLYSQSCARCHGVDGQGTRRAPTLNVKSYLADTNDAALQQIITLGVSGTAMPAWGDRLTDADIQAIVGFIRSWEPTAPEVAAPARGGGGPWWAVQGGTKPNASSALPSGGVQPTPTATVPGTDIQPTQLVPDAGLEAQPTPTATSPTPTPAAASAAHQPGSGAGGGQGAGQGTGQQGQGGGPAWQQQNTATTPSLPDWRMILLFGGAATLAIALIGSGLAGLRKLSNPAPQPPSDP
jgi:mono/diheme cytochrome c family protein